MEQPIVAVDEGTKTRIAQLIEYANNHRISLDELLKIVDFEKPPVGDRNGHSIILNKNYRVVYSIEELPNRWVKHISISVKDPNSLPSPGAVEDIVRLFDFPELWNCQLYLHSTSSYTAINAITTFDNKCNQSNQNESKGTVL